MNKKLVRTLLRVSSRQQLHGDDIPLQRAETKNFIEQHSAWVFDREYIEKAVSGYKNGIEDREVLMEILEDARKHEFDILLTYMSDRIGRREEYSFYISTLNNLGVEVWTVKDGLLKSEEHIDKLLNYIRFWQNEGESKKTSMRVRDAQIEMIKSGKFVGGKAPYGYRLIDSGQISSHGRMLKKLEIVNHEAEVVRKIYDLYVQKGYGYEKIAKELDKEGIAAITTEKWKSGTVCSIIKNPVYMGYYAIHRRKSGNNFKRLDRSEWIISEHQNEEIVIISPLEWEKAQEIRESKRAHLQEAANRSADLYEQQYHAPFNPRGRLALLGIAHCGYCGKKLRNTGYNNHWRTKDGEEKVSCVGRYGCPEKCKERSSYSQDFLESTVFQVVEDYLSRLKSMDITEELQKMKEQQMEKRENERKEIAKETEKITKEIKALYDKLPDAIQGTYCFSEEELAKMIGERKERLEQLKQEDARVQDTRNRSELTYGDLERFASIAPDWKQVFGEADVQTKRMLLASLIERIDVMDENISIKFRIRMGDFMRMNGDKKVHETIDSGTTPYTHDLA